MRVLLFELKNNVCCFHLIAHHLFDLMLHPCHHLISTVQTLYYVSLFSASHLNVQHYTTYTSIILAKNPAAKIVIWNKNICIIIGYIIVNKLQEVVKCKSDNEAMFPRHYFHSDHRLGLFRWSCLQICRRKNLPRQLCTWTLYDLVARKIAEPTTIFKSYNIFLLSSPSDSHRPSLIMGLHRLCFLAITTF